MSAIRLARAATGREKVLKFAGAYHGHVDGLLAEGGSGLATQGIPASPGVPAAAAAATIVVPWNDPEAVQPGGRRARARGDPRRALPGQHGSGPSADRIPRAPAEPRRTRRERCSCSTRSSAASGWPGGGAQELSGVLPDLVVMGKVIGGGLPAAAFGGPARADGANRPGRRRLPGGHPVGESRSRSPPGSPRCGCSTTSPTPASPRTTNELAAGLREAAGDRPVQVVSLPGLVTDVLLRRPGGGLRRRGGL